MTLRASKLMNDVVSGRRAFVSSDERHTLELELIDIAYKTKRKSVMSQQIPESERTRLLCWIEVARAQDIRDEEERMAK